MVAFGLSFLLASAGLWPRALANPGPLEVADPKDHRPTYVDSMSVGSSIGLQNATFKVVDLGYARYQTDVSLVPGVTSFLGIRFAAPPTGELRFQAPQKPENVTQLQNATSQPKECYQGSIIGSPGLSPRNPRRRRSESGQVEMSEDCLFLNVHVPSVTHNRTRLPVVVYIYSGGYDAGNLSDFPVQDFVHDSNHSLIAVQMQYRLGPFGFLSGREIKERGALNAGLLDQHLALEWVHDHISRFGGDPTKVTIWGQSSGAGSVLQHIVAHGGRTNPPLFRAAIMNSPFLPFQYHFDDPIPEVIYSEVASRANCNGTEDRLACLRAIDPQSLLAIDVEIGSSGFMGTYSFVPVVDGTFIIERPTRTLKHRKVNGDTLLVSTNSHEGDFFVNQTLLEAYNFTLEEYIAELFPRMGPEHISYTADLYSSSGFESVFQQASAVIGDCVFVCPAYYALHAFRKRGYKAEFAIPPGTHGSDLPYEFSTFGLPAPYTNIDFHNAFSQSFLSTAMSLNPNTHFDPTNITPHWDKWANEHGEMLYNKTRSDSPDIRLITTDSGLLERCEWWLNMASYNAQ